MELIVPIPKDMKLRESLATEAQEIVERRAELREKARRLSVQLTESPD
jgi:hypothetical protein